MMPPRSGANAVLKPTTPMTTRAMPVMKIVFSRLMCRVSPSSPTSRSPTAIVIVKTRRAAMTTQRLFARICALTAEPDLLDLRLSCGMFAARRHGVGTCRASRRASRVDAAVVRCLGNTLDGKEVCALPQRNPVLLRPIPYLCERAMHHLLETSVDLVLVPEERLQILDPLEIGDRHAAGVGEDVGYDGDAALLEQDVRVGSDRTVGRLEDEPRLNTPRVLLGDLVLECGGHQHIAGNLQDLAIRESARAGKPDNAPGRFLMRDQAVDIETARTVDCAAAVRNRHDGEPLCGHQLCSNRPCIPESLDGDR